MRKFHEQETQIELGRAIGTLSEIERNIRSVAEERYRAGGEFSGNGAMLRSYMLYVSRLDSQKDILLADAAQAELVVEAARVNYIEASKERKVLDKLKEKLEGDHRKMVHAEETKMRDDQNAGRQRAAPTV